MDNIRHIREAAATDDTQCPECFDTGAVCPRCVLRYELQVRQRRAPRLSSSERFALALLAVFAVFLAAVFHGNREIASAAAYGLFIGGGAVAFWSLGRSLW